MKMLTISVLALLVASTICAGSVAGISAKTIPNAPNASGLVTGPDGNVWFAAWKANAIGRLTRSGDIKLFPLPNPNSTPVSITLGVDGNLWFTEQAGRIGRMTLAGAVQEFNVGAGDFLNSIVAATDGSLWFIDQPASHSTPRLCQMTIDGQVTMHDLGNRDSLSTMITGPDGDLWLFDATKNAVLKVSTKSGTVVATYPMPSPAGDITANQFAIGPDANLWLTHGNSIARIKPSGSITEYAVPTADSSPSALETGGDGSLWFTEYKTGKIGQLIVSSATDSGQATINESDPLLGRSAVALTSLPGTVRHSTSSSSRLQTLDDADDPCVEHQWVVYKSEEFSMFDVVITNPPEKQCADLSVSAVISFGGNYIVQTTAIDCRVVNNGPSPAANLYMNCNAFGGPIVSSAAQVQGNCTFKYTDLGVRLENPSMAKGESCSFYAPFGAGDGENVVVAVSQSDTFDPNMGNNTSAYGVILKGNSVVSRGANAVPVTPVLERGH